MDNTKQKYYFTSINVPTWHKPPRFKESRRFEWVNYGEANNYPDYLINLYNGSPTHQAIISGKKDYIFGKGITASPADKTAELAMVQQFINRANRFENLNQVLEKIILDYELFNGFALKIYQNIVTGKITEIYHTDWAACRVNDEATEIYYSKQWTEQQSITTKYAGAIRRPDDLKILPAFDINKPQRESVLYFREYSPQMKVYPLPGYLGCNAAIETEIEISNFHLNNIKTGFAAGTMLTFTNGVPTEDEQDEIERQVKRKVAGTDNAGEIILYFTDGQENTPQVVQLRPNDLDKQYGQLKQSVMDTIFIGHKVTSPMLFGVRVPGQLGGRNEMREAYELFQNTYIHKRQQTIEGVLQGLAQVNGIKTPLTIEPTEPIGLGLLLNEQEIALALTDDEKREYIASLGLPVGGKEKHRAITVKKVKKTASKNNSKKNNGYNLLENKIFQLIEEDESITIAEMARQLFETEDAILSGLTQLENSGLIKVSTHTSGGKTIITRKAVIK